MLKPSLGASISPLLTRVGGVCSGAISPRTTDRCHLGLDCIFSSFVIRSKFCIRTLTNPRLGFQSLQQPSHSSCDDGDAFAELGPPVDVANGVGVVPKLMTEKRELFKKNDPARKSSYASRTPFKGHPSSTTSFSLCRQLENHNDASEVNLKKKGTPNLRLNSREVDDCKWSAHVQGGSPTDVDVTIDDCRDKDGDRRKLESEIASRFDELRSQASVKKICAEDLEYLHLSIMHLESRPKSFSKLSSIFCKTNAGK